MLFPKKVKHRKWQSARRNFSKLKTETRGTTVSFGSHGLKATAYARVKSNQIESARKVISRTLTKAGKYWIRIFPDKPITTRPAGTRMGSGKGAPEYWVAVVRPGRIIFEAEGVPLEVAKEALRLAAQKLPVQTRFVVRRDYAEA